MRYIVTEGEVRAILPGTLLVDRQGWPMTRTHEGEFAAWTPDQRWAFYSVDEITGAVPFGDASPFLPLSSPDEDPGESPAARGRAVLSEDADPEVWHRLARWELEGARWTWDPEVNNVVGLLIPGEANRAIAVVYADGDWEVDEERLFEDCSRAGCDQATKPGDELCGYHRGDSDARDRLALWDHLVTRHEETPESMDSLVAEARGDHPGRNDAWLLELIHNRQHTSLDWDAGHAEDDR